MARKYSSEEIVKILHSIKKVELDQDGCIMVQQDKHPTDAYITSFKPDSFTYALLSVIEEHLK